MSEVTEVLVKAVAQSIGATIVDECPPNVMPTLPPGCTVEMDDRGYGSGAAAALTAVYRRRAVRFVAGSARDAGDAALILEALGLEASEGREETAA